MTPLATTCLGLLGVVVRLAAAVLAGTGTACGSADPAPQQRAAAPPDAGASCPATFAQMNAAACDFEGLECPVAFACEVTSQLARCTCRAARWRCDDSVGLVPADAGPRCVNPASPTSDPCPASVRAGQGAPCDELGKACFYDGQLCTDGVTRLDYCECQRDASGSFAYACTIVPCPLGDGT